MKPTVKVTEAGRANDRSETYEHPAYGVVTLHRSQVGGKGKTLFQSDIKHHNIITLAIHTAEYSRNLNRSWYRPRKEIIEVEMSEAQFGQLISSFNQGCGSPVTLTRLNYERLPDLESESMADTFSREMECKVADTLADYKGIEDKLRDLIASGKTGKKNLEDLLKDLSVTNQNTPKNIGFVHNSFVEQMEKATLQAKIEIQAVAQNQRALREETNNGE